MSKPVCKKCGKRHLAGMKCKGELVGVKTGKKVDIKESVIPGGTLMVGNFGNMNKWE